MKPPFHIFVLSLAILAPSVHAQQTAVTISPVGGQEQIAVAISQPALGEYLSFPSSGLKIRQPASFEKSGSFDGFGQPASQASVVAMSVAGPYSKITEGFAAEPMKARGFTFLSREDVKIDGLSGVLVHFEQPTGGSVFLKWVLAFGDEQKTRLVTASFPKEWEGELSARLKSSVMSTRLEGAALPPAETELPYTIEASAKLKITPGISKALFYTKDGVIPVKSPKDPMFIVAPSLGQVPVADKQQMAEWTFRDAARTKAFILKSTAPITISGLDGYESLASGEEDKSGTPLFLYQVMLFDGDNYVRMIGVAGQNSATSTCLNSRP